MVRWRESNPTALAQEFPWLGRARHRRLKAYRRSCRLTAPIALRIDGSSRTLEYRSPRLAARFSHVVTHITKWGSLVFLGHFRCARVQRQCDGNHSFDDFASIQAGVGN